MDLGSPVSYKVLEQGTKVLSSDRQEVGHVAHVLAAEEEDVFDGIVIAEGPEGIEHRFADADDIAEIHEHAVLLKLDARASRKLPTPSANPAVMRDDPGQAGSGVTDKLRRAWDLLSGNY